MNLKELYQEIILEHGKNPRNLGKTENLIKMLKAKIHYVETMFMFI
jgi:nitrogen fixation NifU-like protein